MNPKLFKTARRPLFLMAGLLALFSCDPVQKDVPVDIPELYTAEEERALLAKSASHPDDWMKFRRIQSPFKTKQEIYAGLYREVEAFPEERYKELLPLLLEKSIPDIQSLVASGSLTYEELALFYLKRIYRYELDKDRSLQAIISLNPDVLEQARGLDAGQGSHHPIYGMPVLLKDNIGAEGMATTAGAAAFLENRPGDAFIVQRLREKGALILGKVNLSEWANYLCDCPNGQSAVGGQTLNPYGRFTFDTGGSSSGSGVAIAANYAVAAVGTETSGSILSPSSSNSLVGMKPTVGLLSRGGIVPISSYLDTPGPMTRTVIDNAILLDAMRGYDERDSASVMANWQDNWYLPPAGFSLNGKRLGFFGNRLDQDTLYRQSSELLKQAGAEIVRITPTPAQLNGFLMFLDADMKRSMPEYIQNYARLPDSLGLKDMDDLYDFNMQDSIARIPYGQVRFQGIHEDTTSLEELVATNARLEKESRDYFEQSFSLGLDAVVTVNNSGAGYAAVAKYPALTLPMGYRKDGRPSGLTLVGKQYQEGKLYHLAFAIEEVLKARKPPQGYEN